MTIAAFSLGIHAIEAHERMLVPTPFNVNILLTRNIPEFVAIHSILCIISYRRVLRSKFKSCFFRIDCISQTLFDSCVRIRMHLTGWAFP